MNAWNVIKQHVLQIIFSHFEREKVLFHIFGLILSASNTEIFLVYKRSLYFSKGAGESKEIFL